MAKSSYISKPGRCGTLFLYSVLIIPGTPGDSEYNVTRWAYDEDHLTERLCDDEMLAGDDWTIRGRVKTA